MGGTSMGGNSAETLHPVTYTPMRGVRGSRDGGLLFAQIYNFFIFYIKLPIYNSDLGKSYSWYK